LLLFGVAVLRVWPSNSGARCCGRVV